MYASEDDVKQIIGRLPIASGISVQDFLDDAWGEMHSYMIGLYTIPVTIVDGTTAGASGITAQILKTIQKEMAGGKLLLSLDTTAESEGIHAYGETLINNAVSKLQDIQTQVLLLPGATLDTDVSDDAAKFPKIGFSSPDQSSFFNRDYNEVGNYDDRITGGPL